jgi:hypothetical protein
MWQSCFQSTRGHSMCIAISSTIWSPVVGASDGSPNRLASRRSCSDTMLTSTTHLRGGVLREISAFEGLSGFAVDSISFHRPSVNPVDYDALRIPLPHSYERRFFEEIFYVSDSRGNWNEAALPSSGSLQLLTHPIWWVGDHQSSSERLQALLSRRGNSIKEAARAYLSNFDELTGESRLAN